MSWLMLLVTLTATAAAWSPSTMIAGLPKITGTPNVQFARWGRQGRLGHGAACASRERSDGRRSTRRQVDRHVASSAVVLDRKGAGEARGQGIEDL